MNFRVEILHEDGSLETFAPERPVVTLGRSLEADVSIPDSRDLEPEHLKLKPMPRACTVEVGPEARTPVLIGARVVQTEDVPWGSELKIGSVRVRLLRERESRGLSLVSWAVVALVPVAGVFVYLWAMSRDDIEIELESHLDPPPIVGPISACRVPNERALREAQRNASAAEARSDRYPFAPEDGVAGVELYGRAAACFRAAGGESEAHQAELRRDELSKRLQEDYTTYQLSLARAIETEQLDDALAAAIVLYRYVSHTNGEYRSWVATTIQKLRLKLEQESQEGT
jgi:hypothetical protein